MYKRQAQLRIVLEHDELPHGHLAPGGAVVVLEHIQDGSPQKFQIILGEAGGLPGEVGRDIALGAVEGGSKHSLRGASYLPITTGCLSSVGAAAKAEIEQSEKTITTAIQLSLIHI